MSLTYNEKEMIESLSKSIPAGEKFVAGIHAVANETALIRVYSNCVPVFNTKQQIDYILPAVENGQPLEGAISLEVQKIKYAKHDVYVGITENYLILTECFDNMHFYKFGFDKTSPFAKDLTERIAPQDIKYVFPFSDIQNAVIKKGLFGSLKCNVTMKDGSYLKLIFPKSGGIGNGMPNHLAYRDKICEKLNSVKN